MLLLVPMLALLFALLGPPAESWAHLRDTVVPDYLRNTLLLMGGVGLAATLLGVTTAWLTATRVFPGVNWATPALVLPLAAPAYVVAYVYTDLLEFAGPVQSALRGLTGWGYGEYWFPQIRSLGGAATILTLVLYPYVYLLARATFVRQSGGLVDAARNLGLGPGAAFRRVALPTARPAIAGGAALVLMETAADFGVVEYFGVPTFTTGIFRAWYALGDQAAALQLAAWLFLLVLALVLFEALARRGRVANPLGRVPAPRRARLQGSAAALAVLICWLPVLLGFLLPVGLLLHYSLTQGDPLLGPRFLVFVSNSAVVAGSAALLAALAAIVLAYSLRLGGGWWAQSAVRLAALGYAMPGAVLGLAVLAPLTQLDHWLAHAYQSITGERGGLWLTGSIAALVFACVVRFLTAAFNACHAGLAQIHPNLDAAGRSLGAGPGGLLWRVHLPLLRPALLSALLLVFIDVLKELPATLILRPFNFETLATRTYRLAADERIAEASTAALSIVAMGVLPTLLLIRQLGRDSSR